MTFTKTGGTQYVNQINFNFSNFKDNIMKKLQLIIIASNILGAEAMADQGFDWLLMPTTPECLNVAINHSIAMEDQFRNMISIWEEEGQIDTVNSQPGMLIWLVEIDHNNLDLNANTKLTRAILYEMAIMVSNSPVHITYMFNDIVNNAEVLLERLNNTQPIIFKYPEVLEAQHLT